METSSTLWFVFSQAALGAVVGWCTNWLAIKLLFQPYRRINFGPFGFGPGVFVKYQDRLAREVAHIASESILTVETLQKKLDAPAMRDHFYAKLREFIGEKLDQEYGPLHDMIPGDLERQYRELVLFARGKLRDSVRGYLESDEFAQMLKDIVRDELDYFAKMKGSALLGEKRKVILADIARKVVRDRLADPAIHQQIKVFTDAELRRIFSDKRPFREMMPPEAVEGLRSQLRPLVEQAILSMISKADLGKLAADVRAILHKYVEDYFSNSSAGFFKRMLSRFVYNVQRNEIEATINDFSDHLPDWARTYVNSPEGSKKVTEMALGLLDHILAMSPAEIGQRIGEENKARICDITADFASSILRSREMADTIVQYLDVTLDGLADETLEDLLTKSGLIDPQEFYGQAGDFVAEKMRGPAAMDRLLTRVSQLMRTALETPIGRPSRFVPPTARDSVAEFLNRTMFDYLSFHSAAVIKSLELEDTIYRKVSAWEPRQLHLAVEMAAHDNLRWLEYLGGILGFLAGLAFAGLSLLTGIR